MSLARRTAFSASIAIIGLLGTSAARGDIVVTGDLGPNGSVGFVNSDPNAAIAYGGDGQGSVYQMDGFVNVQGQNYNSDVGNSADLDDGPPPGIGYTFAAAQPTAHQLLLTYTFVNNSGADLPAFEFLHYVDPDDGSNYPYEYATVNGTTGTGADPTSFQVSDATYGSIFTNIGSGMLSDNNALPSPSQTGDVSFALGFSVGTLGVGEAVSFEVLLSDDGSPLGDFSITQVDQAYPADSLTVSGAIIVPEPGSATLLAVGSLVSFAGLRTRRPRKGD